MPKLQQTLSFLLYLLSCLLVCGGVDGVLALISSVNIEDGLGSKSLAISYATCIFPAFVVPVGVKRFGPKKLLVFASLCSFLFVLGNISTNKTVLILSGVFNGFGESIAFTAGSLLNYYFAIIRSQNGKKSESVYMKHYFGYYWTATPTGSILGNLISFLILYTDRQTLDPISSNMTSSNMTSLLYDYSTCGAADCQADDVIKQRLMQYQPVRKITRTALVGSCALLVFIGMILQILCIPSNVNRIIQSRLNSISNSNDDVKSSSSRKDDVIDNEDDKLPSNSSDEIPLNNNSLKRFQVTSQLSVKVDDLGFFEEVWSTLKQSFCLLVDSRQLLVMFLPIYNGLEVGFIFSEMTRAYTSCILGLDKVSISVIMFGVMNAGSSLVVGRLAGKYGRQIPMYTCFVFDICLYFFCLLWKPQLGQEWIIYLLFLFFGTSEGLWSTIVNEMYGDIFKDRINTAYNLWGLLLNLGMMFQFAISTSFCIYSKIYFMIIFQSLALFFYTVMLIKCSPKNVKVSTSSM